MEAKIVIAIGMRFGKWTVLGKGPLEFKKHSSWLCRCDCGTEKFVRSAHLKRGLSTTCGCSRKEAARTMGKNRRLSGNLQAIRSRFNGYRYAAKNRDIEFHLTIEEFISITAKDCHYCGAAPSNVEKNATNPDDLSLAFIYSGIDRLDNSQGYTIRNSVPCCRRCNLAKNDQSLKDFLRSAELVASRSKYREASINMKYAAALRVGFTPGQAWHLAQGIPLI